LTQQALHKVPPSFKLLVYEGEDEEAEDRHFVSPGCCERRSRREKNNGITGCSSIVIACVIYSSDGMRMLLGRRIPTML